MRLALLIVVATVLVAGLLIARRIDKRTAELRQAGMYPQPGQETVADVDRLLQHNHKIEAIKVYRVLHRVGLKDAKEAVEQRQRELGLG